LPVRDIIDDMKENSAGKGYRQKTQIIRKKDFISSAVHGVTNNPGPYALHHASMSHTRIYFLED